MSTRRRLWACWCGLWTVVWAYAALQEGLGPFRDCMKPLLICDTGSITAAIDIQAIPVLLSFAVLILALTPPPGKAFAGSNDEPDVWRTRARRARAITKGGVVAMTAVVAAFAFVLLILAAPLSYQPPPTPQPSPVWVEISAIGTLAAGLGTIVSGIAALIAIRISVDARKSAGGRKKPPASDARKP